MRLPDELQRAHDLLITVLLNEAPSPFSAVQTLEAMASVNVLCWVLGHAHNQTFSQVLHNIEQYLNAHGFEFGGTGELQSRRPN